MQHQQTAITHMSAWPKLAACVDQTAVRLFSLNQSYIRRERAPYGYSGQSLGGRRNAAFDVKVRASFTH
jgi:hypothetical protein